jgi:hypothetical protein
MKLSQPVNWVNKPFVGYIVNTEFSDDNAEILGDLISEIQVMFNDAVFCMPKASLHTTLLDWIAPLVDYGGQDKDRLFAQVQPTYDTVLSEVLSSVKPITIQFDELKVSPTTIFMVGHDSGEFQNIRQQFLGKVELLPDTKLPPQIIHSSLARFTKPTDLGLVNSFLAKKTLNITQTVTNFRLIRTTREPMLEFEVLKRYKLS